MFGCLWEMLGENAAGAREIPYLLVSFKLVCAIFAGSIIGFERSFHGRPVGIRTYSLVCLASASLVQGLYHLPVWLPWLSPDVYRADPTRVMFAILEGIAFLCLGVILRQGFTFRGLTTAVSVWLTAIIGILFGIGFFYVAGIAAVVLLLMLIVFVRIERKWATRKYVHCNVVFARDGNITRESFFGMLKAHRIETSGRINHQLINEGRDFEVDLTLRSAVPGAFSKLSEALRKETAYKSYSIQSVRG